MQDVSVPHASVHNNDNASLLDPQLAALERVGAAASSEVAAAPAPASDQTLSADAITAISEQQHMQHAERQDAIEQAILQADQAAPIQASPLSGDMGGAELQSKLVKEEKLEETVMGLLRDDLAKNNSAVKSQSRQEADPSSGSSDLSTEGLEPSVNGNADTSGSARGGSTSPRPDAEASKSQQSLIGKDRSASVASSVLAVSTRPQRRTASSAKKEEKDVAPISSGSRTSARRGQAKDKEKEVPGEKPPSSSGGTARTRGLAQKAQDKADKEKEKEKRRTRLRPKGQKGDGSRSLQGVETGQDDEEEDDGAAHGAEDEGDEGVTRCICGNNGKLPSCLHHSQDPDMRLPARRRRCAWLYDTVRDLQSMAAWPLHGLQIRGRVPRHILLRAMPARPASEDVWRYVKFQPQRTKAQPWTDLLDFGQGPRHK